MFYCLGLGLRVSGLVFKIQGGGSKSNRSSVGSSTLSPRLEGQIEIPQTRLQFEVSGLGYRFWLRI